MKRFTLFVTVLLVGVTMSAQEWHWYNYSQERKQAAEYVTYNVFYSITSNVSVSGYYVYVQKNEKSVKIFGTEYSLHRLGTITSSGEVFDSFYYGDYQKMFCISQSSITLTGTSQGTLKGYVIMIDGKSYLARKL